MTEILPLGKHQELRSGDKPLRAQSPAKQREGGGFYGRQCSPAMARRPVGSGARKQVAAVFALHCADSQGDGLGFGVIRWLADNAYPPGCAMDSEARTAAKALRSIRHIQAAGSGAVRADRRVAELCVGAQVTHQATPHR